MVTGSGSKGDQTKLVYLAISLLTPLGRADQLYLTFLLLKIPLVIPSLRFCIVYLTRIQRDFFAFFATGGNVLYIELLCFQTGRLFLLNSKSVWHIF